MVLMPLNPLPGERVFTCVLLSSVYAQEGNLYEKE